MGVALKLQNYANRLHIRPHIYHPSPLPQPQTASSPHINRLDYPSIYIWIVSILIILATGSGPYPDTSANTKSDDADRSTQQTATNFVTIQVLFYHQFCILRIEWTDLCF